MSSRWAPAADGRLPHEGAGPCLPLGGGRLPDRTVGKVAAAALLVALIAALLGAASLAACGDSSAGGASSPPASTTPSGGASPLADTPREAVAAYWRMVDADDYSGLAAAAAPGSSGAITAAADDIAAASLLRVTRVKDQPGGVQVQMEVRIVPTSAVTPWGEAGRHTLFLQLTRAPSGGWLVAGWGTSP